MVVFGTLFGYGNDHARTVAVKAVARANDLELDFRQDLKSPDHLKVNKLGKVPAFEGTDGFKLFETIAIALYFTSQNEESTTPLLGKSKKDYAEIVKWMSYFNTEVMYPIGGQLYPLVGAHPYNKELVDIYATNAKKATDAVEEYLREENREYLVGDTITLADIFCASLFSVGFRYFYGKVWREENPNLFRWFERMWKHPAVAGVLEGELVYLDEPRYTNKPPEGK
ncbi:putative glutathione S-transferase [Poronia punctata]|nr:putative glutathione S-transferase [Poronia punctata]